MKTKFNDEMNSETFNADAKMEVFNICRKLQTLVPPVRLNSVKADETIQFWLPEIPVSLISQYKKEFMANNKKRR